MTGKGRPSSHRNDRRSQRKQGRTGNDAAKNARADFNVRTAVKGTITLTENKKHAHEEISRMTVRMRQLENAIAEIHKRKSSEPHPLLVGGSNDDVPGLDQDDGSSPGESVSVDSVQLDDHDGLGRLAQTLGMLSMGDDPYHTVTAVTEHLVKTNIRLESTREPENVALARNLPNPLSLPPGIFFHNFLFPLSSPDQLRPEGIIALMDELLEYLPTHDTAMVLLDSYLSFFGWVAMPVPTNDLENILRYFYPGNVRTNILLQHDAHALAISFMVFALGTLYDLRLEKSQLAAKTKLYYCLARTALVADPLVENTSLYGVQALLLMIWYLRLFPGIESVNDQWGWLGILCKTLQSIALHRDKSTPTRRIEEQREYIPRADERLAHEQTFYEFLSLDIWQSCMLGRPPSMSIDEVDCKLPNMISVSDGLASSFYIWKYSFSRLVSSVMARMSGTTETAELGNSEVVPVEYKDILELERRLREHYIPEDLVWPALHEPLPQGEHIGKTFQRFIANVWKKTSIMYLHKQYFYHAVSQHKYDPTKSSTWHSVEVAYDSAVGLVSDVRRLWFHHPTIINRMCSFWSHSQSAATILGTLVMLSPGCQFASDALDHLDKTCDLFERATNSLQPLNALSNLREIRSEAHERYRRFYDTENQFGPSESLDVVPLPRSQSPFGYQFYAGPPHLQTHIPGDYDVVGSGLDVASALAPTRVLSQNSYYTATTETS